MKRWTIATTCLVAALGLTLSGCSGSGSGSGKLDSLTVAYPTEASSFDPVISTEVPASELIRNVFETLLTQNSKGEPVPMLAKSFKQSSDNKTIDFTLRTDVKFHDGSTMKADDVVASMQRWLKNSAAAQASFPGAKMVKVNDEKVTLKLASPNSAASLVLSYGESSIPYITTAKEATAADDTAVKNYIGTGPFTFSSWNKGRSLELKRFVGYTPSDGAPDGLAGDRTAGFDNLTYEFTKDSATQMAGLQSGKYDVAETIPYDNYDQLKSDGSLATETTAKTSLPNLYFNKAQGLFKNVEARKALSIGLDREALLKGGYSNSDFYEVANGCMMPASMSSQWPCAPSNKPGSPNPDEAKELLKKAGYKGETVKIITSPNAGRAYQVSTVLEQQLKNLGFSTKLESYDYATLNAKRAKKDAWDLIVINNIAKAEPLQALYIPANNPGWTDQKDLAPVIKAYSSATTAENRKKVYETKVQGWFSNYLPVINIGSAADLFAYKSSISGITTQGATVNLWKAKSQ